ncbi:MarR family winged helix-turn-helix transcriptional regulator [Croceiramulus getboli]|nr:MarR family transcriptional regulator [Flavobacteriaceae bacterium YJPT1-3]
MIVQDQSFHQQLTFGLEKIYEAYKLLLWEQSKKFQLTPIQIRVLLFIAGHGRKENKVGVLAREFGMTKATMSETVRILEQKKLIEKQRDTGDARSFAIALTRKGEQNIEELQDYQRPLLDLLYTIPEERKISFYETLTGLLHGLKKEQKLPLERHCYNCGNRRTDGARSFCMALRKPLPIEEIRLECSEHESLQVKTNIPWKRE